MKMDDSDKPAYIFHLIFPTHHLPIDKVGIDLSYTLACTHPTKYNFYTSQRSGTNMPWSPSWSEIQFKIRKKISKYVIHINYANGSKKKTATRV